MAFERVASLSKLPSSGGLCVTVRGQPIGIFRVGDRVYAVDDVCPHAGFPLHEGEVEGRSVICPGHGWAFDLETGLAPGEIDEEPLPRYEVRIDGDDVLVDV